MPQDVADAVQRDIERMPDRQILDFLVQYFVAEVNWSVFIWCLSHLLRSFVERGQSLLRHDSRVVSMST